MSRQPQAVVRLVPVDRPLRHVDRRVRIAVLGLTPVCNGPTNAKRALVVVIEEFPRPIGDPQLPAVRQVKVLAVILRVVVHNVIVAAATDTSPNRFTTVPNRSSVHPSWLSRSPTCSAVS